MKDYRGVMVGNISVDLTSALGREPVTRRIHVHTEAGRVLVAVPHGDCDYGILLSLDADSAKLLAYHLSHAGNTIDPTPSAAGGERPGETFGARE
jgi:hypothetical protein